MKTHIGLYGMGLLMLVAGGCGAQPALLGVEDYLFITHDTLALPGETVDLSARVLGGDLLQPQAGLLVRFARPGEPLGVAETDGAGQAVYAYTPAEPGDYLFDVDVAPIGLADPPPVRQLRLACRPAHQPMAIVDLDHTVVATGFETVLLGDAKAMDDSVAVLKALAEKNTIVYLTHRPELFGPKSKQWLAAQGYPPGPVLLSSITGFVQGSGEFKAEQLRKLRSRFKRIEIGIGDKISDARAYAENGMQSVLINLNNENQAAGDIEATVLLIQRIEDLPESVAVVRSWQQAREVLFDGAEYPPAQAVERLEKRLGVLRDQQRQAEEGEE